MTPQQHLDHLEQLTANLQPYVNDFADAIGNIAALRKTFAEKVQRFSQDQQQLNIAIMGQVKAGKSSFLNALLFNGKPVLPEASTPKTANLTRITYGDTPTFEVEYYNSDDWREIEQAAQSQGDHPEAKAARELIGMAQGIDVQRLIQQGKQTITAQTLEQLMGQLEQYVGNNGQYTALVKMTRLFLPIDDLKGFDIIDTPGMNDPVISRTLRTKEEMSRCDVVFFLSRCSQFLDASDMSLLAHQLPSKGVKRLVLVAGQYDAVILDDGYDRESLAETETNLRKRIVGRAATEMTKLADQREQAGSSETADILRALTKPILASTYAHTFASLPAEQWSSPNMAHVHGQLREMADDYWNGYQWTQADWQRIGNFGDLINAYQNAKTEKMAILQEQIDGLVPDASKELREQVQHLHDEAEHYIQRLQKNDLSSLATLQKQYEGQIKRLAVCLQVGIGDAIVQAKDMRREAVNELQTALKQYRNLSTRTGARTETESYSVSTSKWYNPFSWGGSETRYRTYTVNYQYMNAADAVEQINDFASESAFTIEREFQKLVNAKAIKAALRKQLVEELNTKNADFDPNDLRQLLDNALDKLNIPDLNIRMDDAGSSIARQFSGEVTGGQMDALKRSHQQALESVLGNVCSRFERAVDKVCAALTATKDSLEQQLTAQVQQELDKVRQGLAEKERSIAHCQQLLTVLA